MIKTKTKPAEDFMDRSEDTAETVSIADRVKFLKNASLFSTFDKEHIQEIAWGISERHARPAEWLCREGDQGDELFVVFNGRVDVVQQKENRSRVIYSADPGEVLGEIAVLGHMPRTAGLRARADTHLFVIKGPHFIQLLRKNPDMSLAVIELLVHRLVA